MTTFIDFSWKVDEDRRRRAAALDKARPSNANSVVAADEEQCEQRAPAQGQSAPVVGISQSSALHSFPPPAAGQEPVPVLRHLGWRRRMKEFLRPGLRKKRALEEYDIAQNLQARTDEPTEAPSLPDAGLQMLWDHGNQSMPALLVQQSDDDVALSSDDEDEITALPPLPRCYNTMPADHPEPPLSLVQEGDSDGPSLEDLADQAMDEALAAADAPGNRSSIRPALPAHWLTTTPTHSPRQLRSVFSDGDLSLVVRDTGFLPLPVAVFSTSSIPLPSFRSLPATARIEGESDGGDPDTPASGRWLGGGNVS